MRRLSLLEDEHRGPRVARLVLSGATVVAMVVTMTVVIGGERGASASASRVPPRAYQGGTISLLIPGITGDGTSRGTAAVMVQTYSFGLTGGTTALVKPKFSSVTLMVPLSLCGPQLMLAVAKHTAFPKATIYFDPVDPALDSATMVLSGAVVTQFSTNASSDGSASAMISFSFTKIEFNYAKGSSASKSHFGWNLGTNKPF